jgi:hypothetical protein
MWLAAFFAMALGAGTHSPILNLNISGVWVANTPREIIRNVVQDGPQFTVIELTRGNVSTSLSRQQCRLANPHQGKGSKPSHNFIVQCTDHSEQWALSDDGAQITMRLVKKRDDSSAPAIVVFRRSQPPLQ